MKGNSTLGRIFRPFVNFSAWIGLRQLQSNWVLIKKILQDMRVHRPPVHQETFEEAMVRLKMTEQDIEERTRTCLRLSILYALAAFVFLIYTLYMLIHLQLGAILGILITVLMATFAYREHFWYFQLKTRTLGNTPRMWLSFLLRGGRK